MSSSPRPPRSVLYAPAHSPVLVDAARTAGPDAIVLDLEDGVPQSHKPTARAAVAELVARVRTGTSAQVVVRVNAVGTRWFDEDVLAVLDAAPDAVLLPKAGVGELAVLRRALGPSVAHPAVWALVERVRDVLAVERVLADGRPQAVVIGYGDLCAELGLPLGTAHPELGGVRTLVLAAGRSRAWLLDGVVVGGPDVAEWACAGSARAGFHGRTLYDPRHVAGCHRAFRPASDPGPRRPADG